jgi:micrococcal nuclease
MKPRPGIFRRAALPAALVLLALLVLLLALKALTGRGHEGGAVAARVAYVIDGDTVVVQTTGGERVHVRLIGIDTPEISHSGRPGDCFGARAARLTRSLALDREVVLEPGRERHDRYGRLLAYVQVVGGPHDLEATLIARGAARTLAIAPNTDRAARYSGLERAARRAGRGLWGACAAR